MWIFLFAQLFGCSAPGTALQLAVDANGGASLANGAGTARLGATHLVGAEDASPACVTDADGARCEAPGLTTWWRGTPEGQEQGWTVAGPAPDGSLRLLLEVPEGELEVEADPLGPVLVVRAAGGTLRGAGLAAWDADRRPLNVSATPQSGGFLLDVVTEGARWPVTVDPIWSMGPPQPYRDDVYGVATADLNLDGYDDVIVRTQIELRVDFGGPNGPDGVSDQVAARALLAGALTAGDVNGDGWPDVVEGSTIFFGGAMGLGVVPDLTLSTPDGGPIQGTTLIDLDDDGDLEVIAVEGTSATRLVPQVLIWDGAPGGPTGLPTLVFDLHGDPQVTVFSIVVGDVVGDAAPDILIGAEDTSRFFFTLSHGFLERFTGRLGQLPVGDSSLFSAADLGGRLPRGAVAVADVDGDGAAEMMLQTQEGPIALRGDATPGDVWVHAWRPYPFSLDTMVTADLDGDGIVEVLASASEMRVGRGPTRSTVGGVLIFRGGALSVQHDGLIAVSGSDDFRHRDNLAVGDFDGDDSPDVVSRYDWRSYGPCGLFGGSCTHGTPGVQVLLNRNMPPLTDFDGNDGAPGLHQVARGLAPRVADVNGDGWADLVTSHPANSNNPGFIDVYQGQPGGASPVATWTLPGDGLSFAHTFSLCDLDGDADLDLVMPRWVADEHGDTVDAWTFDPLLGWSPRSGWQDPTWSYGITAGCGDVDGDGLAEVAVSAWTATAPGVTGSGSVSLYRSGGQAPYVVIPTPSGKLRFGTATWVEDVNGDHLGDLVVGVDGGDAVEVWYGPTPAPGLPAVHWNGSRSSQGWSDSEAVLPLDLNGDGRSEYVFADQDDTNEISGGWGYVVPSRVLVPGLPDYDGTEWRAPGEQMAFGTAVAGGPTHGPGSAWLYTASARSGSGNVSFGTVRGRNVVAETCNRRDWEAPDGLRADHADSITVGNWNGDAFPDLLVGSSACDDPDGCVFVFVGSPVGPIAEPGVDADGDGHPVELDCNDANPAVFVGAAEVPADGVDEDCNGLERCFEDADQDQHGSDTLVESCELDCGGDWNSGTAAVAGDCDDHDNSVHPGGNDPFCCPVDGDCDGIASCWLDADGDGFNGTRVELPVGDCAAVGGSDEDDCDEQSVRINPGATERPGDQVDQDCDGWETCFADADVDGRPEAGVLRPRQSLDCSRAGNALAGPWDTCFGEDSWLDADGDRVCGDVDLCPTTAGEDPDGDAVCAPDLCIGDDTTGDANGDGRCDDAAFLLVMQRPLIGSKRFTGRITGAPPNTTVRLFETVHGRGAGPCAPGGALCLDLLTPSAAGTVRTDASGQARFDVPNGSPPFYQFVLSGEMVGMQAVVIVGGVPQKSNAYLIRAVQ